MNERPNLLTYQPPAPANARSVEWHGRQVSIELSPMPTVVFVSTIVPAVLGLTVALGLFVGLVVGGHHSVRGIFYSGIFTVALAIYVYQLSRHRACPRRIWASVTELGYSDARTAGQMQNVDARRYKRVRVARSTWRPWIVQLVAEPDVGAFRLSNLPTKVLALDTSRLRLQELVALIESARTPVEANHVRGAFEVIPMEEVEP